MPKLYLIAGHTQGKDEGAQNLQTKETENQIARNLLLQIFPEIKKEIFTDLCPFDLTLEEQTAWVNKRASSDDLVLCLHLNSTPQRTETGALCFFYGGNEKSKEMSAKLLDIYCRETGLKNLGVQPDTASRFGRLGIVRDTAGWSFLLELGSINNDLPAVKAKATRAILSAVRGLLGLTGNDRPFTDVDRTHPFFEAAKWAKEKGVAAGYGDGRLGVDEDLKVGRFLAFLKNYDQAKS